MHKSDSRSLSVYAIACAMGLSVGVLIGGSLAPDRHDPARGGMESQSEVAGGTLSGTARSPKPFFAHGGAATILLVQEGNGAVLRHELADLSDEWRWNVFLAIATVAAVVAGVIWLMARHYSDEKLRRSEERFRRVLESSAAIIYQLNLRERRYEYVSPAYERLLGYPREHVLREGLAFTLDKMHPDDRAKVEGRRARMIAEKDRPRRFYEVEYRLRASDGRYVWLSDVAEAVKDAEGNVVATVGTASDITARKRLEEENEAFNRELQRLLEVARRLGGDLVDEVRVLRNAVSGVVEAIAHAEAASAWLLEEDGESAVPIAWAGHRDEEWQGLRMCAKSSLVGETIRNAAPVLVVDTKSHPAFVPTGLAGLDSIRSVVGVPLVSEGRVVGALFAERFSTDRPFQDRDLKLIEALGAQASVALENARLLEHVRHLATELIDAQEAERRRIAHELHDEVGGQLTSLSLLLNMGMQNLRRSGVDRRLLKELAEIEALTEELAEQIRGMALQLRPTVLDDLGVGPAVRWFVDRFEKQTGISVRLHSEVAAHDRYEPAVEISAYRVVQEALNNVARHANVETAQVVINKTSDGLRIHVIDEGVGFRYSGVGSIRGSLGLAGMYERISHLGGGLEIDSEPGDGTRISASIPARPHRRQQLVDR